jgi:hypothetical protein
MNLREENGYTYGARSNLGTGRWYNSSFMASTKVRNMVTDSAVVEILKEIKRIKTEPVDAEMLSNAKAKFLGNFILQSEDKTVAARRALSIKTNKLPEDFYKNYIANINAVTVEDVQRIANKYFTDEKARIVLVGKAADILENVEKIEWNGSNLPIKYFDKKANPTEKPEISKPIPEGVTALTVMEDYIEAIGGKSAVDNVNTLMINAEVTIEGAPFKPTAVLKSKSPNKMSMEMSIAGMGTIMKQKFDGNTGYAEQQGMKQPMSEEDITEQSSQKGLFPEAHYSSEEIELVSLGDLDGNDAYKIKVIGTKESFRYYDASTGLLLKEESTEEAQGQSFTSVTIHSDYKEVNGVLIPFSRQITTGPQVIGFNANQVLINSGVTDEDFK